MLIKCLSASMVLLLSSLSLFGYAQAKSSVFKVSGEQGYVFVAGTIHMLREEDLPLPEQFQQAYAQADQLMFETNILDLTSLSKQNKLMQALMLPSGDRLSNHLSSKTYQRLQQYLLDNQLPVVSYDRYTAEGVYVQISTLEMLKAGFVEQGVDMLFAQQAQRDGKSLLALESIEQQIDIISDFGIPAGEFIGYLLDELPKMSEQINLMMAGWRAGNAAQIIESVILPMQKDMPKLYNQLLKQRNLNWMADLQTEIADAGVELILVGAGHLYGEDSVLALLQQQGYVIEQL